MAKFKIGDRVRALSNTYSVEIGWEGVVQENGSTCPRVLWESGKPFAVPQTMLQLITKTNNMNKVKIAVSFENYSEKLAYLRYCESIGKVWCSGHKPTEYISKSIVFAFETCEVESENYISHWSGGIRSAENDGYTVVPFRVFAVLKGIDYKPVVEVKLNDKHTATILDGKVKVGCQEFEFERIEELYKAIQEAKK